MPAPAARPDRPQQGPVRSHRARRRLRARPALVLVALLAAVGGVVIAGGGRSSDDTARVLRVPRSGGSGVAPADTSAQPAPDAGTAAVGPVRLERLQVGRGARGALITRPVGTTGRKPWIVFLHGWGLKAADYGPWIRHLARRGSVVVAPRYQRDSQSDPRRALGDALAGVRAARRAAPAAPGTVIAIGHSAGAALAADYAAVAARQGLPRPVGVYAVYPGRAIRGYPGGIPQADLGEIERRTRVEVLAGARDRVVGSAPARQLFEALTAVPPWWRRYRLVSDPAVASHLAPTRSSRAARRSFWRPSDRLVSRSRAVRSGG